MKDKSTPAETIKRTIPSEITKVRFKRPIRISLISQQSIVKMAGKALQTWNIGGKNVLRLQNYFFFKTAPRLSYNPG